MLGDAEKVSVPVRYLFLALMVSAMAVPNSLKLVVSVLLAFFFFYGVFRQKDVGVGQEVLKWWVLTTLVTLFYMTIGVFRGAPVVAVGQIILIYVISPLLWTVAWRVACLELGAEFLRRSLIGVTVIAFITVPVFIVSFQNGQMSIVHFFSGSEGGNVNIRDGYAATTMHVYGSLVFLLAGLFAAPQIIHRKLTRYVVMLCGLMVVLTSGRSALMLAVVIGVIAGWFMTHRIGDAIKRTLIVSASLMVVFVIAQSVLYSFFGIDVWIVLGSSSEHVMDLGGMERRIQFWSLLQAASDSYFLGAGHGIGTDSVRSISFPWRYELVWLAVLMKTGLIGFCMYAGLFASVLIKGTRLVLSRWATPMDRFMMGGYLAAIAASPTNPYIEAVMLQWMYVLPIVHFILRTRGLSSQPFFGRPDRPFFAASHTISVTRHA